MQKQVEILAIIPARIGSSEVKKKNIRKLCGKPLIYHTIKSSLASKVTRTIVSTDSIEIRKLAEKYGAEVPFLRPKKYALNHSSAFSVIKHCLEYLKKKEKYEPDYIIYLQPTSPFRKIKDIDNGIKKILESNSTSLVGVTDVENKHPYWTFKMSKLGRLDEFIKIKNKPERRQDLPRLYIINAALYISKKEFFDKKSNKSLIFDRNNCVGLKMDYINSYDINTEFDFQIADLLCKKGYQDISKNTLIS